LYIEELVYIEIVTVFIYLLVIITAARRTNFTGGEKSLLVDLVTKFSQVVENKQTDACTTKVIKATLTDT